LRFFAVQLALLVAEALEQQLCFVRERGDRVAHLDRKAEEEEDV